VPRKNEKGDGEDLIIKTLKFQSYQGVRTREHRDSPTYDEGTRAEQIQKVREKGMALNKRTKDEWGNRNLFGRLPEERTPSSAGIQRKSSLLPKTRPKEENN